MSEQTASQWRLKVGGGDQVIVKPGESLEIGRKPLRPLPDEGIARLEIADATKSMSKRHARFSVAEDGDAVLRDLDSTNGSYVVTPKGELMRLPAGRDVPLDSSPMRIQFGDVPVDFVRVEPDARPALRVPNLFDYTNAATAAARQEPDAADMSVDQILDLRAGEPTAVFDAQHAHHTAVMSPLTRIADIEPIEPITFASITEAVEREETAGAVSGTPSDGTPAAESAGPVDAAEPSDDGTSADDATVPVAQDVPSDDAPADAPDDAFSDTPDAAPIVFSEADSRTDIPVTPAPAADAAVHVPVGADGTVMPAVPLPDEPPADSMPLHVVEPLQPALPRDLFADARGDAPAASDTPAVQSATVLPVVDLPARSDAVTPAVVDAVRPVQSVQPVQPDATSVIAFTPMDAAEPSEDPGRPAVTPDAAPAAEIANGVYTPAFEPGSVFDKVAKGEFDKPEPQVIEVDGFTSDDARRTSDMTVQFEMARHPELLPFLAMNPSLYDDLYAWLAAQGDRDIDEALAHNTGYQDYRHAVGK